MVPTNYLAVVISAIAAIVLGFLWYGPLFGKQMMEAAPKINRQMARNYSFIGALAMVFVMSHAIVFARSYLAVSGISAGLQTGFWSWIVLIAPVMLGAVLWGGKSWKLWSLAAGYYLVSSLLTGVILGLWA